MTKVAEDPSTLRKEYVQRTKIFRFPDVVTFQIIPLSKTEGGVLGGKGGKSSIAVHSYSIFGAGDLGMNAQRVKGFLAEIDGEIASLKR